MAGLVVIARRLMIVMSLATSLAIVASCRSAMTDAARPDPLTIEASFVRAFNDLDLGAMSNLFADDATAYLPFASSGPRLDGRTAIAAALEPLFTAERKRATHGAPYLSLAAKNVFEQRLGPDAAIVTFDVGNEHVFSRRTLVVRYAAGGWKIVHLHASNIRPEGS